MKPHGGDDRGGSGRAGEVWSLMAETAGAAATVKLSEKVWIVGRRAPDRESRLKALFPSGQFDTVGITDVAPRRGHRRVPVRLSLEE